MILYGLLALAALAIVFTVVMTRLPSKDAARLLRWVLGIGGVVLGALLTVRGLAVAGVPLIGAALGFLGVAMRGGKSDQGGDARNTGSAPSRTGMSVEEARAILGVEADADEEAIRKAHRAMMKKVHPDQGGTDALAAKVQEARDVLLGD
ncbi:DnaJ domain-containing protein [Oceanicaulis alexandrii]|uniref:DnaJ domain-containing protein n=1 Tax=Oceanicaulis alexandrii TaxID=153233 RepID=UPI003B5024A4